MSRAAGRVRAPKGPVIALVRRYVLFFVCALMERSVGDGMGCRRDYSAGLEVNYDDGESDVLGVDLIPIGSMVDE